MKKLADSLDKPVYIVGGYVRNSLMGLPPADTDICGELPYSEIGSARPVNPRLGTALVKIGDEEYEYTPFRSERYPEGGAHSPEEVTLYVDLRSDALRRDFTANSVYYDVKNGVIVDPLDGAKDIENKILRAYNPEFTFKSDGLRLMRLVRFAAELGFEIEEKTFAAAYRYRANLADIAPERKAAELSKILVADLKYGVNEAHYRALKLMTELGLWKYVIPEIEKTDIPQNPKYHRYSLIEHIFQAVKFAPPEVRTAALLHDIGKPECLSDNGNMYEHAKYSARSARKILGGLRYDNAFIAETSALCGLHMYDKDRKTSDAKMLLFTAEHFAIIDKLQSLAEADSVATGREDILPPRFAFFKRKLIESGAPITLSMLKVDGRDFFDWRQKKRIGEALRVLQRECILQPELNERERLLSRIKALRKEMDKTDSRDKV